MTRKEFEAMSFEDFIEWAYDNLDCVTDEEVLKDYAINELQDDNFGVALHIINAIYDNPYDTEYYRYDYSMGTLETPTPITEKEDLEDLICFDDEE